MQKQLDLGLDEINDGEIAGAGDHVTTAVQRMEGVHRYLASAAEIQGSDSGGW